MHPYERWMIRCYLANALKSKRYLTAPEPRADLLIWIRDQGRALKLPTLEQPPVALRYCMDDKTERRFKANWRIWRTSVLALPLSRPFPHCKSGSTGSLRLAPSTPRKSGRLASLRGSPERRRLRDLQPRSTSS